ncbi:MAG: transcriptional regulator [Betaproteobacteria bacterium]|nr:transcriptional regulator [Betaproteobacteria bacterium]
MRRLSNPVAPDSPHVDSLITLGQIVRARRLASGLRIDDAAALCAVSVDLMSRLENGHAGVSSARLLRVFDALGLAMFVLDKESIPAALKAPRHKETPPG